MEPSPEPKVFILYTTACGGDAYDVFLLYDAPKYINDMELALWVDEYYEDPDADKEKDVGQYVAARLEKAGIRYTKPSFASAEVYWHR